MIKAYILHRRDFRDTSLIVDFFTEDHGVFSAVAKGAKRPKSKLRAGLHFFSPLFIDCYGKHELLGLKNVESAGGINLFSGKDLLTLLYVNELLNRLLQKHEPHPVVFSAYEQLISQLKNKANLEISLRKFEILVLQDLGYGLDLVVDNINQQAVSDVLFYQYNLEDGVKLAPDQSSQGHVYQGSMLKKIQAEQFDDRQVLSTAKILFRTIFNELLQHKPLNSRQLFTYKLRQERTFAN